MLPMWCKQGSIETIGQKRVKEEWLEEYYPECNIDLSRNMNVSLP